MTTIQSGCDAPDTFKFPKRPVFLQPVPPGAPLPLAPLRAVWDARQGGSYWTFSDHTGNFLSVSADGSVVDTFPADDASGRQRWTLDPLPNGGFVIKNYGGMDPGAPRFLARMGNLKVRMRRDAADHTCRWLVAVPPAMPPVPPMPPSGTLAPRDVLLQKRGNRALPVLRESPGFCMWAGAGADQEVMARVLTNLEKIWTLYTTTLGFREKPEVVKSQGWDRFKKSIYLSGSPPPGPCEGCPESGHGFEYQGWEGPCAFLVTGGYGPEGGCVAHETGHLAQVATGAFGWGGTCPWAWESSAQFMRWHGCPTEEDAESLKPWLKNHASSIERHDGADTCYAYGSWYWWVFMDAEFGVGTTGRVWAEARAPEMPMAVCARLACLTVPDLHARFLGAVLTQKHFRGTPRWDRVNKCIGHEAGWNTWDALREVNGTYQPVSQNLEKGGFHALRLADAKLRGPKKLRLDAAGNEWRMVVVVDAKVRAVLKAGETSEPVPLAKTTLGICVPGDYASGPQAYSVVAL